MYKKKEAVREDEMKRKDATGGFPRLQEPVQVVVVGNKHD